VAVALAILCYRRSVVRRRWVDCCQNSETKKYPVNRGLQGIRGSVGVVEGRHFHRIGCWGGVVDIGVGEAVSSPEYIRVKKSPVIAGLQGY
jgi:hypothetical protein